MRYKMHFPPIICNAELSTIFDAVFYVEAVGWSILADI